MNNKSTGISTGQNRRNSAVVTRLFFGNEQTRKKQEQGRKRREEIKNRTLAKKKGNLNQKEGRKQSEGKKNSSRLPKREVTDTTSRRTGSSRSTSTFSTSSTSSTSSRGTDTSSGTGNEIKKEGEQAPPPEKSFVKIDKVEERGMSVNQLIKIVDIITQRCNIERWTDREGT